MKRIHKIFTSAIVSFWALGTGGVFGATFTISELADKAVIGQLFEISVYLNSDNQRVNAAQGDLIIPTDILELEEIHDGNSIIVLWVEQPHITENGKISFSGIIPGGYAGVKGFLFSIIVRGNVKSAGSIYMDNLKALLNDGLGTETKAVSVPLEFTISDAIQNDNLVSPEDTEKPEPFVPLVSNESSIFDGQWFLVFATQDKGSGIERYEVKEGNRIFNSAESPYLLKNQSLDENIYVKAVDKAGNSRVVILPASHQPPWYKQNLIWIIIILVAIFSYLARILWREKLTRGMIHE